MSILCKLFGHQAPVYYPGGWYSPGEEYAKVGNICTDGVNRVHAIIYSDCPRCGEEFRLCRIHIPVERIPDTCYPENKRLAK